MTRQAAVLSRSVRIAFFIAMAIIAYFSTPSWIVRVLVFLWLTVPIIWWTRRQARQRAVEKTK
jgi:hypothetical protein